jgi:hypothetical protein
MRITLRLLGLEVLDVWLSTDAEPADDVARDLSGGTLSSQPVGFTARWELPDGAVRPEWDDGED